MNSFPLTRVAAAAMAAFTLSATAQDTRSLAEITITGNPLGTEGRTAPVDSLSGTELLMQRQPSLGETLNSQPGLSSTYFGPTASRPVIRGLDGDRIRILSNGTGTADASGLSYDHAVAVDPIAVERIEVLRGPAALLYGGSAVGGVVNLIDNRIPRQPLDGPLGRADLGWRSGSHERSGAVMLETGNERIGLHVDAYERSGGDVRVPLGINCEAGDAPATASRLCNSAATSRGGAVGASLFLPRGRIGASLAEHRSEYGSAAEDSVRIGMVSQRLGLEGQWRVQAGGLESVLGQWSTTRYRHAESEGGVTGTEFRNRAGEGRLEVRHQPLGPLRGVLGLQAESGRFSADGQEVYAPYSRTSSNALFLHEELSTAWGRLDLGARTEQVRVRSQGHPTAEGFEPSERRFTPASVALGALWRVAPQWELTSHLARSERAPRDYELFAGGPHVATGAWEVGDPGLQVERSTQFDIGAAWKQDRHSARVTAYARRFANYIALSPTEATEDDLPVYAYQAVPARFRGLEATGNWRAFAAAPGLGVPMDVQWRADRVQARQADTGEALPRIAPWRAGATLVLGQQPWSVRVGFDRHGAQERVPDGQQPTAAYTLWHLGASWRAKAGPTALTWHARVDNLTNELAYSATSILTQTAPGRVPLPGRSLRVGLQADF